MGPKGNHRSNEGNPMVYKMAPNGPNGSHCRTAGGDNTPKDGFWENI